MLLQNDCRLTSRRVQAVCLLLVGFSVQLSGCGTFLLPRPSGPNDAIVAGVVGNPPAAPDPVIVFLEPLEGLARLTSSAPALPALRIEIREGEFLGELAVVSPGQSVEFASDGGLLHRFFSYEQHNTFELDSGESTVVLRHPGIVHFYCSLHSSEGGTIFVAPSPYFDEADEDGNFHISGVPPGRYRLATFSGGTQQTQQAIALVPGGALLVDVRLARPRATLE